jgi:uncharacterized membrane protein
VPPRPAAPRLGGRRWPSLSVMALVIRNRVVAEAPCEVVWDLLRDPERWPEFEVFLSAVEGAPTPVEAGRSFHVVGRAPVRVRVPVDVRVVRPGQQLGIRIHTLPGVVEDVDHLLVPLPGGRTDIEVRVTVRGPLAPAAFLPLRISSAVVARQLAAAAARSARGGGRTLRR